MLVIQTILFIAQAFVPTLLVGGTLFLDKRFFIILFTMRCLVFLSSKMIQHAVGIFSLRNGGFAAVRFSVPKESIFGDGRDVVFFVALFGIKKVENST